MRNRRQALLALLAIRGFKVRRLQPIAEPLVVAAAGIAGVLLRGA